MCLSFLMFPRSLFSLKRRIQPFIYFTIVFCLFIALLNWKSILSNFLALHISWCISFRHAGFLPLIFVNSSLSSSFINFPSLPCLRYGHWWFFECLSLSATLAIFSRRFLKCSFNYCFYLFFFFFFSFFSFFFLDWQISVFLSICLFLLFHSFSIMLKIIISLQRNFWFYGYGLKSIIVLLGRSLRVLSVLS